MSNYTTLIGAEDIRVGGNAMSRAAEQMQTAAMAFETVMERHQRFMDDWLLRLEQVLERERFGRDEDGYRLHIKGKEDRIRKKVIRNDGAEHVAAPPRHIGDRVRSLIAKMTGFDLAKVTDNAAFIEDLDCDSLDLVELVMAFEKEFGIEVPDSDAENLILVKDVIQYIEKAKGGGRG